MRRSIETIALVMFILYVGTRLAEPWWPRPTIELQPMTGPTEIYACPAPPPIRQEPDRDI